MIAALFVQRIGCYWDLPGVDPWDEQRDAKLYNGPWPVVAHPPCERWGRYWYGGQSAKVRRKLGDDGGCFESALASVRRWGGVLEHPETSYAWGRFGIPAPNRNGGWQRTLCGGWTCCVEQGSYGHPARKATWLYMHGCDPIPLRWGPSDPPIPPGRSEAWKARAAKDGVCVLLSRKQRAATPIEFRDLLISIARTAKPRT